MDPNSLLPLRPLTDVEWPASLAPLRDTFATDLNVYRVMAHHPPLVLAWRTLRDHIVTRSALGPERAEVVVIRCGVEWRSSYEIAQHRYRARMIGFTPNRIAALVGPREHLAGDDRLLADAVADLVHEGRMASERNVELFELLGAPGVLDLLATVGMYATLAFLTNSCEVPLEEKLVDGTVNAPTHCK